MITQPTNTIKIFFSYAPGDESLRNKLGKHLRILEKKFTIEWYDHKVDAGQEREQELFRRLNRAHIILLLVSPNFMESHSCYSIEMKRAMERHEAGEARVIPVLLRPVDWEGTPFDKIQVLPTNAESVTSWANQDEAFLNIAQGVRKVIEELATSLAFFETNEGGQKNLLSISQSLLSAPQGPPFDETLLPLPERFVGREADFHWLLTRLRPDETHNIAVLRGMAGIGKTALAARVARQLRKEKRFPDGIAVVLCDELTDATDVLRRIVARFDSQGRLSRAEDRTELAKVTRSLFEGKNILIVLDSLGPGLAIEQVVEPLRATKIAVLLLARHTIPSTVGSSRKLELLSSEEALNVFAHAMGNETSSSLSRTDQIAAERIVRALGRHTLTVRLAGGYAASFQRDLGMLAQEIEDDPRHALKFSDGEHYVALIFDKSIGMLPPDVQNLFIAFAAFGTADFGRRAALELARASIGIAKAEESVNLLIQLALLDPSMNAFMPEGSDRERLWLHPLLRVIAAERFARKSESEREAAYKAIAHYYAIYTNRVAEQAIEADENNIIYALNWAHSSSEGNDLVAQLCTGMRYFWRNRGRTADALLYLPWGKAAAELAAYRERLRVAYLTITHGQIFRNTGQLDKAEDAFKEALALLREIGDQRGEGEVLCYLGDIACRRGRPEEAENYLQQSLPLFQAAQNRQGESKALIYLGYAAENRGNLKQAEELFQRALTIARQFQDRWHESQILAALGHIDRRLGKLENAKQHYKQSLDLCRELRNRQDEGIGLAFLGETDRRLGKLEEAYRELIEGLSICREVQDKRGEGWTLSYLGKLVQGRGELAEAENCFQCALAIAEEVQDRWRVGEILAFLGDVAHQQAHWEEAEQKFKQSLATCQAFQDKRGEGLALLGLGRLAQVRSQFDEAERCYRQAANTLQAAQDTWSSAQVMFELGIFLVENWHKREEGRVLLIQAQKLYTEMGLPQERSVRDIIQKLDSGELSKEE